MRKRLAAILCLAFFSQNSGLTAAGAAGLSNRGLSFRFGGSEDTEQPAKKSEPVLLAQLPSGISPQPGDSLPFGGNASKMDFPQTPNLAVLYPSIEFDPYIGVGMILVIGLLDAATGKPLGQPTVVKVRSDDIVSIPGLGPLKIVGKKLSYAEMEIRKLTGQKFTLGLMMGDVNTVQVLGKVQKPGNYPGDLPLTALIAEALDRAPGSNYKIHVYNGATRKSHIFKYEDVVKGKENPIVPAGSIVYFYASASAIFGEMTKEQVNLAYLVVITLSALGITLIVKQ